MRLNALSFLILALPLAGLAPAQAADTKTTASGPKAEPVIPKKGFTGKQVVPRSSIELTCEGGKKITLSSGSSTGTCWANIQNGKVTGGQCNDGANQADANCGVGCTKTTGAASCSVK